MTFFRSIALFFLAALLIAGVLALLFLTTQVTAAGAMLAMALYVLAGVCVAWAFASRATIQPKPSTND